jgi:hypothetical protein
MIKETNDGQHLKDHRTFAFLVKVSSHTVTILDEINNLTRLNTISQWIPIGLQGQSRPQSKSICQTNFGEGSYKWYNNP